MSITSRFTELRDIINEKRRMAKSSLVNSFIYGFDDNKHIISNRNRLVTAQIVRIEKNESTPPQTESKQS